jgi:protein-disulfide isomerase
MSSEDRRPSTLLLLWVTVALTVAVITVLAWKTSGGRSTETANTRPSPTATSDVGAKLLSHQRRQPDDPLAIGRVDALVVLIAYEDFRCPYCAKFSTEIQPRLIERYVTSGVLRIEWRDFPVLGEESMELAKAARAAARQGKFWEFHDVVYAAQEPSFSEERIQELAREAGVPDLARFNADRADPAIERAIKADVTEGRRLGVFSTPTFLINTQPLLGAQPWDRFITIIEAERTKE